MRYKQKFALAGLTGLLVIVGLAMSAAPSGATLVCPAGVTSGPYCTNYPPTAVTNKATGFRSESATLNGIAGPTILNGDATNYVFQYGKTNSYGRTTSTGTVGSCPAGESGVNYCKSPATQSVSTVVRGLTPCTRYHFRLDASNPDGTATGADRSFKTNFLAPISSVSVPNSVGHSRRHHSDHFTVTVKLKTPAKLSVELQHSVRRHHRTSTETVEAYSSRDPKSGTVKVRFTAPGSTGKYTIKVIAKLSCGSETRTQDLNVT